MKNPYQNCTTDRNQAFESKLFPQIRLIAGICLAIFTSFDLAAQPWSYDFGTSNATHPTNSNSTSFLPSTPAGGGTYRVRTGSASGVINLANPGTSLGVGGSELQIQSSTSGSTNKFGVYSWSSPSTASYLKVNFRTTSGTTGNLNVSLGISNLGSSNNGYTGEYNSALSSFTIAYTGGAISSVVRRISGSNTTITGHGFSKDANHVIEVYGNNAASSANYVRSGTSYTLATRTWDLWVDGTRVVAGAARAGTLAAGINLDGFAFFAESSTSNSAYIYLDDLEYSNKLPNAITTAQNGPWSTASTWNGGVVPTSSQDVIINHTVTSGAITRDAGTTTTVSSSGILAMSGTYTNNGNTTIEGSFQLDEGSWATGNNFKYGSNGTLIFNNSSGAYGVNNHAYWPTTDPPVNVTVKNTGGINMQVARTVSGLFLLEATGAANVQGTALTLNGTTRISSSYFQTVPIYGSSSTLQYNTTYGTYNEWNGGGSVNPIAGTGIPANVEVLSGTLTLSTDRGVPGNVTVASGATLNLGSGDLYLGGNFVQNGSLTNNNKAVQFVQGNAQSISRTSGTITFDWLVVNKSANHVSLSNSVVVNNTVFLNTNGGNIQLGANNLTAGAVSGANSGGFIHTASTGQLMQTVAGTAKIFPVGNSAYNPITLTNSGTSDTYGIRVDDIAPPSANDASKLLNKTWYVSEAVAGGGDLAVVAQYNAADPTGANYGAAPTPRIGLRSSGVWSQQNANLAGSNPITASSTANFNQTLSGAYFGVGKDDAFIGVAAPPTIGSFTSTPNDGTPTNIYVGSTIVVTGTNFLTVNVIKYGGSGGTTLTPGTHYTIDNSTQITITVPAGFAGALYIENPSGNVTGATFVNLGYITQTGASTWQTASSWLGSSVPPSNSSTHVTIAHNISGMSLSTAVGRLTVNTGISLVISTGVFLTVNSASTNSGTINVNGGYLALSATYTNSGTINLGSNGNLQLNAGGFADGAGTYNYGANGTLIYSSGGTYGPIDASHTYWPVSNGPINVTIASGAINMGMSRTVPSSGTSGTFRLTSGAAANAVQGTALTLNGITRIDGGNFQTTPTYGSSSILQYSINYNTYNEWTGGGSPSVTAGSGVPAHVTILSGIVNLSANRGIPGTITVNSGGELNLNAGDLYIGGNLVNNGNWSNNNKAVWFVGTGTSNIEASSGTQYFDYLIVSKSSGSVRLDDIPATNVTINTTVSNVLQILDAGTLDLNGRTLTFNNNGGYIYVNGNRTILSSQPNAQIVINGLKVVANNAGTGTLTFGTSNNFTMVMNDGINFGKFGGVPISSFAGTLRLDFDGFVDTNPPVYLPGSVLIYNTGTFHANVAEWTGGASNTVAVGEGIPETIIVQNAGTNLNLAGARGLPGNLTVSNGASIDLAGDLYSKGNITLSGTGLINFFNYAVFFCNNSITQTINSASALTIPYVVLSPPSGGTTVQMNNTLTVSAPSGGNAISFNSAADVINLNGQTLTIGTAGTANAISGAGSFRGSSTSNLTLLGNGSIGTLNFQTGYQNLGTLNINRQNGIVAANLGTALTVNTALQMNAGHLALGNNNLTLASSVSSGNHTGSANSFVIADGALGTGRLVKAMTNITNGSLTLHIGDNSSPDGAQYTPAALTFSGGTFSSASYGIQVNDLKHPNNGAPTDYITRYWSISPSGTFGGSLNYAFTGTYASADINGTETNSISGRWNGSSWTTGAALAGNTLSISGLNSMPSTNEFSAGSPLMLQEINVRQGVTNYPSGGISFDFGNVGTGTTSAPITFTIENLGMANLTITTPLGDNAEFTVQTQPGNTVSGGSSTTFTVRFTPAANGVRTGSITIVNNDADEGTYILNVSGTGVTPVPYNYANNNHTYVSVIGGSSLPWDNAANWYRVYNRAFQPSPDWPDGNTDVAYLRGDFTLGSSSKAIDSLTIEGTGTLITGSGNYTVQGYLHILSGGVFNFARLININGVFEVEDGGTFTYSYTNTNSRSSSIWNGVEKFHPNSNFIIYNTQNSASFYVIESVNDITPYPNASGYCFGNFILDKSSGSGPTLFPNGFNKNFAAGDMIFRNAGDAIRWYSSPSAANLTTTIGGDIIFESTFNQNVNVMTQTSLGAVNVTVLGDIINNGSGSFSLCSITSSTSINVVFNVEGNIAINSGALLFNGGTSGSTVTGTTLNLKGDLSVGAAGLFANMNTASGTSKGTLNLIGTYNPMDPASIQTIDIGTTSHVNTIHRNKYINFNVNPTGTGAWAQLANNNLELGNNSTFTVYNGGTMHFGFSGSTALNLVKVAGASSTTFDLQAGGKIFITSPNGIDAGTAAEGNVQLDSRNFNNNTSTSTFYHYVGKAPSQRLGDGLPPAASAKRITVELEGINTQLLFEGYNGSSYVALPGDVNMNTNGGLLITQGTVVGTENTDFVGNGPYTMTGGIWQSSEVTNTIPQMAGASTLTGGTIELNAAGDQILKGTIDYNSLTFSGSGTKTLTSGLPTGSIDTLVTVKDAAILDVSNNEFSGPAGLLMSGTSRFRMSQLNTTLPQLTGINAPYSISGGTVELYGTNSTQQHVLRGTYGSPTVNVTYFNVDLNSNAANLNNHNINMSASISVLGTMTVFSPTVFRLNPTDVISGIGGAFEVKPDATLFYAHPLGIRSSSFQGNIQTSGRIFSSLASYGFTGTGDMDSGTGLPSTVKNLYVKKNVSANVITLTNPVTVSDQMELVAGVINNGTNLISINNTNTNAIIGGSAASFVSGRLTRNLPANLLSGSTYDYPVGKLGASTYLPLSLVNPTTGAGGASVRIEAFNVGCGGTASPDISHPLSTTEYWALAATGDFNGSQFTVSRPSNTGTINCLARSTTTSNGSYSRIDGTPSGNVSVSNSNFSTGNTQFLAMALIVTPSFTAGATDICQYSSSTYTTQAGMSNYVWNLSPGGSILSGGTSTDNTVSIQWNGSGAQWVSVNYTENGYTAPSPTIRNVNVSGTPDLAVTAPPPACLPSTVDITESGAPPYVVDNNALPGTYTYHSNFADASAGTPVLPPPFNPAAVDASSTIWMRKQTGAGCVDIASVVVSVTTCNIVWTGAISTDWDVPGNWNVGIVPTDLNSTTVFIPKVPDVPRNPIIQAGVNGSVNNIYFYTGAFLTITGGQFLDVKQDWTAESSTIIGGEGTVRFSRTGPGWQNIYGSTTFPYFNSANPSSTLYIQSGMQTITRALQLSAGALYGNGRITLASDATHTALIDNFSTGYTGSIVGNVTVNRHINGARGYRYLSNPIQGSTIANFGPSVSGANGLVYDPNNPPGPTGFPTCWIYNENDANAVESQNAQWGWVSSTITSTPLVDMKGYAVIINGTQTLSFTGIPNSGTYNLPITFTSSGKPSIDGYNLAGNPYPSPISWNAVSGLNSSHVINVVKRFANTSTYVGQYADWNGVVGTNGADDNIALGQAFFVKALPSGTNLTMNNSVRRSVPTAKFFEDSEELADVHNLIRLKLSGGLGADEAVIYSTSSASNNYDPNVDAVKMLATMPGVPNIYTKNAEGEYSINGIGILGTDQVIPLDMLSAGEGIHKLEVLELLHFEPTTEVYLEDRSNHQFYNLRSSASLEFNLPAGVVADRFYIHFQPAIQVSVANETCKKYDGRINISNPSSKARQIKVKDANGVVWFENTSFTGSTSINGLKNGLYSIETKDLLGTAKSFEVEVSSGKMLNAAFNASALKVGVGQEVSFKADMNDPEIAYKWVVGNNTISLNQAFTHTFNEAGIYPIRLNLSGEGCSEQSVKNVEVLENFHVGIEQLNNAQVEVYPNPVNHLLNVNIPDKQGEKLASIEIVDASGRLVYFEKASVFSQGKRLNIPTSELANGAYSLNLLFGTGTRLSQAFVVAH